MKKLVLLVALLLATMLIFSACSQAATTESGSSESDSADGDAAEKLRVGVSLYYKGDEWCVQVADAFEELGEAEGWDMTIQDANCVPEAQKQHIDNFVAQGMDMIIFDAIDPEGIGTTLDEVQAKGVPVINYDEGAIWDGFVSFVAWDQKETGKVMGEYIKDYIDKNLGGEANILILTYVQSLSSGPRIEGFLEAVGATEDGAIKVVGTLDPENVEEKAANMVQNFREDYDIIFAVCDPPAFGAVNALEAMQKENVKVFSCGGFGERTFSLLQEENEYFQAVLVVPPYELVRRTIDVAKEYFAGETDIPERIDIECTIADASNVDSIM